MSKHDDESPEARIEKGRKMAMDSVLQDACSAVHGASADGSSSGGSRRLLWIAAGVAASILGVWTLLWGTGALRPNSEETAEETNSAGVPAGESGEIDGPGVALRGVRQQDPQQDTQQKGKPQEKKKPDPKRKPPTGTEVQKPKPQKKPKLEIPLPDDKGKIDIPATADPSDIRALRSAQAMLKAEKKLAEMIKSGKIDGADRFLSFDDIAAWRYDDGLKGLPEAVKKFDGQKVMMTGFMLPIDEVENIKQFLLVQSLWSCCYGTPPDINGTVRVVIEGKKRIDYMFEPLKMVGTFRVKPTIEDGFCVDIYQLETSKVEAIE